MGLYSLGCLEGSSIGFRKRLFSGVLLTYVKRLRPNIISVNIHSMGPL